MNSIILLSILLISPAFGLNLDGTLLLSFKYSILSDPLSVLDNWDYNDATPCQWTGVICASVENTLRVTTLTLPNSKLLGIIPEDLGFIPHLKTLDLSSNILNGNLPKSLFNASELQILSLSKNAISGVIPEPVSGPTSLKFLNLSGNALTGPIPVKTQSFEFLDLSSNSLNASLPLEFDGLNLHYLNLSSNKLSGLIPREFAQKIPANATIDLSSNNFSGEIPDLLTLTNQKTECFEGNVNLCGKPLKKLCVIPSTLSSPPNLNTNTSSSPAIAAIPINPTTTTTNNPFQDSSGSTQNAAQNNRISTQHVLKPAAVAGIVIIPLAGIGVFAMIALYIHQRRKKTSDGDVCEKFSCSAFNAYAFEFKKDSGPSPSSSMVIKETRSLNLPTWTCLSIRNGDGTSEPSTGSDSDHENVKTKNVIADQVNVEQVKNVRSLVMVDGETELEIETLFKASAYVLGSSGPSIIYKAVLQDGTAFAVRRIGDGVHQRMKEFESQVRGIAKMRHGNLVRVRGFCWGDDEKLVIYDYVSNGSLANVGYRKMGSSPYHLSFETRLKIAKGVARGLTYIHGKKNVHGNIKPNNILLTPDMEPIISDYGLQWLLQGKNNHTRKSDGPARHFGSNRSPPPSSHDELINGSPCIAPVGFVGCTSPYHAPESLDSLKPSPKWDVYSFGILLLELLTGKVFSDRELSQWTTGSVTEDPTRVLRMADVAIRGDGVGREEALLAWFKLGFSCASLVPQKRPCMKDALHVLEKIPCWSK